MELRISFLLLCSGLLSHIAQASIRTIDSDLWSHKLNLEEDHGIRFRWRNTDPDKDDQRWIIMEVTAKARGYVGVGFSPHGGMDGADMALSWMDSDGVPHLRDFYGVGNAAPVEDTRQDYHLLDFNSVGDSITVKFKRRWDTCDEQDFVITNDTMRLIWSYSDLKPRFVNGNFIAEYHGPRGRGAKSVIIAEGDIGAPFPDVEPHLYPGAKNFDMMMTNVNIDFKDTYYFCKMFKFQDLSKKHHVIGWKPMLQKGNADIVHHMLLFECSVPEHEVPLFDEYFKSHPGGTCYTPNMPPEIGKNCVAPSFVWVVGSEGEMLPEHVGNPLGEQHGGATYFMLEMHYENAAHRITTDSSGMRLFYTDQLREHDGGIMLVGYRHSPFLLIPPRQDNFIINGVCGTECTNKIIPPTGIHLTNAIVHLHLTGKKIRLRHIRNGHELPVIAEDNHYDFNYQQGRILKNELTILPGDELLAECEYTTANVDRYVIGGLATNQEMCQVFFFYYPRVPLAQCTSQYEFHDFFEGLGIDEVEGKVLNALNMPYEPHLQPKEDQEKDIGDDAKELEAIEAGISFKSVFNHMNITKPSKHRGKSVGQYLEEVKWSNAKGKVLEGFWREGKQYQFCSKPGLKRVILENHIVNYPKITKALRRGPAEVCQRENVLLRSSASINHSTNTLLFMFVLVVTFRNM